MRAGLWQSRLVLAGVCLCMLWLSTNADASEPQPMPEVVEPDEERLLVGVVRRVIDGDSVEMFIDGRVVHYELAGADAPDVVETANPDSAPIRGSEEAKSYLHQLLDGEEVAVMPDPARPTDARGRARGYLYRLPDRMFVNLEMVRIGMSRHARNIGGFNNEAMVWAQDRARDAKKGIWAPIERVVEPEPAAVVAKPVAAVPAVAAPVVQAVVSEPVERGGGLGVVYITKSGSKYHRKDCQHARDSGIAKRRSELDKSYSACKVCDPDSKKGDESD